MASTTVELYGLKNCDSCRRALRWFAAQDVSCTFRDIRDGAHTSTALRLIEVQDNWEAFLNRRSTTWRNLPADDKADVDRRAALRLMAAEPTLIKRPVLNIAGVTLAGFDEARVAALVR